MKNIVENRKGSTTGLIAIGYALLVFGLIVGMGSVVLTKMGDQVVSCADGITSVSIYNESGWLNGTGYQLKPKYNYGIQDVNISILVNMSDESRIALANVSYNASGFIVNTTAINYLLVNITYTYKWDNTHTWNATRSYCVNVSNADPQSGTGNGYNIMATTLTNLGSSGLVGWIPLIIVVLIASFILVNFGLRAKTGERNY